MNFPMAVFDDEAEIADQETAELAFILAAAGCTLAESRAYGDSRQAHPASYSA